MPRIPILSILSILVCMMCAVGVARGGEEASIGAWAHEPHYTDVALWPAALETAKAAYAKEVWPPAPVLRWSASGWKTADGKPSEGPDENTDVVFPAGTKADFKEKVVVRHVTVEPGAKVRFNEVVMGGNLWIQKGGSWQRAKGSFGANDKNTFVRTDNPGSQFIMNMLYVGKKPGCSVEMIGKYRIGDEVSISSGDMIIAPGSTFQHTDRREVNIYAKGSLVLLSGSTWEARGNLYHGEDMRIGGRLLAGTPERPLTADCTIGLSFKCWSAGTGDMATKGSKTSDVGLLLMPKGSLVVTSSDTAKARLAFRWHRHAQQTHEYKDGEPAAIAAMPHGICMRLLGEVGGGAFLFNDVVQGGIQLPEAGAQSAWTRIDYGEGNFAKGEQLFSVAKSTNDTMKEAGGRK